MQSQPVIRDTYTPRTSKDARRTYAHQKLFVVLLPDC